MNALRTAQRAAEAIAYTPYAHAFASLKMLNARALRKHYQRIYRVPPLETLSPESFKTSDTLFVLGSGASVNEYSEQEWAAVRSGDSMGFNFWCVHDFVPDIYVIEPPRSPRDAYLYDLMNQRAGDYKNIPLVLKASSSAKLDLDKFDAELRGCMYVGGAMPLPGRSPGQMVQGYTIYEGYGIFKPRRAVNTIVQQRASLPGLIHLAVVWGYQRVVLCGVDLNNTSYFYEEDRSYYEDKGRCVPTTGQSGSVHKTMESPAGGATVEDVLYAMDEVVMKPYGVEIMVALSTSALYPRFSALFR